MMNLWRRNVSRRNNHNEIMTTMKRILSQRSLFTASSRTATKNALFKSKIGPEGVSMRGSCWRDAAAPASGISATRRRDGSAGMWEVMGWRRGDRGNVTPAAGLWDPCLYWKAGFSHTSMAMKDLENSGGDDEDEVSLFEVADVVGCDIEDVCALVGDLLQEEVDETTLIDQDTFLFIAEELQSQAGKRKFQKKNSDDGAKKKKKNNKKKGKGKQQKPAPKKPEPVEKKRKTVDLKPFVEDPKRVTERPPIVTIMGHVDHGKTTLLDYLRKASVAAGEAGGITQHISAFSVVCPTTKKLISFLDTPGHAAFSDMRKRGASVTDIIVVMVAADDGIMPQTKEVLEQAKAHNVPIIVALNKCDKQGANPKKVKNSLFANGVQLEDYGGDVQCIEISALKGTGIAQLEEAIVALSEISELSSNPTKRGEGFVIESRLKPGLGNTAILLVRDGILRQGDFVVAHDKWGRMRKLTGEDSKVTKGVNASFPCESAGWKELPTVGTPFIVVSSEAEAKDLAEFNAREEEFAQMESLREKFNAERKQAQKERRVLKKEEEPWWRKRRQKIHELLKNVREVKSSDERIEVPILLKSDVLGTLEALEGALESIPQTKISLNVINRSVGPVLDADVETVKIAGGVIVAFNSKIAKPVLNHAQDESVEIINHNVIYKLLDELRESLAKKLPKISTVEVTGQAEVLDVFNFSGKSAVTIAGCSVLNGELKKNAKVKVMRGGEEVYAGDLSGLQRGKERVDSVQKGFECGVLLSGFKDFEKNDTIESFVINEEYATLE
eukprot:Nk52_evm8s162 gene=Nk52_evmTU8s162